MSSSTQIKQKCCVITYQPTRVVTTYFLDNQLIVLLPYQSPFALSCGNLHTIAVLFCCRRRKLFTMPKQISTIIFATYKQPLVILIIRCYLDLYMQNSVISGGNNNCSKFDVRNKKIELCRPSLGLSCTHVLSFISAKRA